MTYESFMGAGLNQTETGDETHIPTIELGSQTPPRLSRAYGNQSRPQDPERTACQRPQQTQRLSAAIRSLI